MNKEEIKELAKETFIENVMSNLDSALIFTYVQNIEQENKQLKEQVDRLIKKEYEKDNNYIVKVRTGEQLEREQYLLNFKSKSMLASMLIDAEERINEAIELLEYVNKVKLKAGYNKNEKDYLNTLVEILKGEENE